MVPHLIRKSINFLLLFVILIIVQPNNVNCGLYNPIDLTKTAIDIGVGIAKKIPDTLPTPEGIFSASKNLVAGYPVEGVIRAINLFCSTAISSQAIKPKIQPNLTDMNFVLINGDKNYSINLQNANELWNHEAFNRSLNTVILVTGWTSNINASNSALELLSKAYACRGGVNFVVVDTAQYVDTLYTWSAFNTEDIGKLIAKGLVDLTSFYPIKNIHVIGHSLGAHISGSIGRNYNYLTGELLPRITGLDPANPCFNNGERLSGLSRGDAEFVDVIHSNPGALGKRDAIGDADFYPNGLDPLPPGCITITCAHGRAYEFYAETVYPGNENSFMGIKCNSLTALKSGYCPGGKFAMGYAIPKNLKGNYFLSTKDQSPYGENSKAKEEIICHN